MNTYKLSAKNHNKIHEFSTETIEKNCTTYIHTGARRVFPYFALFRSMLSISLFLWLLFYIVFVFYRFNRRIVKNMNLVGRIQYLCLQITSTLIQGIILLRRTMIRIISKIFEYLRL